MKSKEKLWKEEGSDCHRLEAMSVEVVTIQT